MNAPASADHEPIYASPQTYEEYVTTALAAKIAALQPTAPPSTTSSGWIRVRV